MDNLDNALSALQRQIIGALEVAGVTELPHGVTNAMQTVREAARGTANGDEAAAEPEAADAPSAEPAAPAPGEPVSAPAKPAKTAPKAPEPPAA
jgi:hypothetical protein